MNQHVKASKAQLELSDAQSALALKDETANIISMLKDVSRRKNTSQLVVDQAATGTKKATEGAKTKQRQNHLTKRKTCDFGGRVTVAEVHL